MQVRFTLNSSRRGTYRGCLGSKWARTHALIPFPLPRSIQTKIYRSAARQLDWFSIHVAHYFSPLIFAEETRSSRIATGIPIAPVKAYGVTQVRLQLAVSRFLAWLYWTGTYRYVGALVTCC